MYKGIHLEDHSEFSSFQHAFREPEHTGGKSKGEDILERALGNMGELTIDEGFKHCGEKITN